jgi:light-regulated signal transduction histidine kinase (bacteriophytochrome)
MNSLLKRQIRKHLDEGLENDPNFTQFINAVDLSYDNFDDHFEMLQRAMSISSDELFAANEKLRQETIAQKEVITKLKNVFDTFKFNTKPSEDLVDNLELDGSKLVDLIDSKTKEVVEINTQRENLLTQLAQQNKELNDYTHMVSHDLKSPLRAIDALTCWLGEDYEEMLGISGNESIDLIRNNVKKMDNLINGILDYSSIDINKIDFYDVNTNRLVTHIIDTQLLPSNIAIVKRSILPIIHGNKIRLKQLFQNLINNAIQNNNKVNGLIEIGLEHDKDFWKFYVKDNGKGIERKYFGKIFKTFQKLENNSESSGIGLSIVKKIINLYGGEIWVESEIDVGSTFYFTIKKNYGTTE